MSFSSRAVVDLGDDGGYDDNYGAGGGEASSPEDVTRAALAAVASARRSPSSGLGTARRMNMSPTATGGSGKKRQPLPREWGAGSVGGSSSGNGRVSRCFLAWRGVLMILCSSPPNRPPRPRSTRPRRTSATRSRGPPRLPRPRPPLQATRAGTRTRTRRRLRRRSGARGARRRYATWRGGTRRGF